MKLKIKKNESKIKNEEFEILMSQNANFEINSNLKQKIDCIEID